MTTTVQKLQVYTYTDNTSNIYLYFILSELSTLFGIKNTSNFKKYVSKENMISFRDYKGKKDKIKIDPRQILVNKNGIKDIINKKKKIKLTDELLNFFKLYDIEFQTEENNSEDEDIHNNIEKERVKKVVLLLNHLI